MMERIMNDEMMKAKMEETMEAKTVVRIPATILMDVIKEATKEENIEEIIFEVKENGALIVGTKEDLSSAKEDFNKKDNEEKIDENDIEELVSNALENPFIKSLLEGLGEALGVPTDLLNPKCDCDNCPVSENCPVRELEDDEEEYDEYDDDDCFDCECDECNCECDCDECNVCEECGMCDDDEDEVYHQVEEDGTNAFALTPFVSEPVSGGILELARVELSKTEYPLVYDLHESIIAQTEPSIKELAIKALSETVRAQVPHVALKDKSLTVQKNGNGNLVAIFFPVIAENSRLYKVGFNEVNNKFYLL